MKNTIFLIRHGQTTWNRAGRLQGQADSPLTLLGTQQVEAIGKKLKEIILNHQAQIESNITDRWKADMNSDSWLSKNVRPLTLIFMLACTMLLIFIDAGYIDFQVKPHFADLLQIVLITIVASYFGGRSVEKLKK